MQAPCHGTRERRQSEPPRRRAAGGNPQVCPAISAIWHILRSADWSSILASGRAPGRATGAVGQRRGELVGEDEVRDRAQGDDPRPSPSRGPRSHRTGDRGQAGVSWQPPRSTRKRAHRLADPGAWDPPLISLRRRLRRASRRGRSGRSRRRRRPRRPGPGPPPSRRATASAAGEVLRRLRTGGGPGRHGRRVRRPLDEMPASTRKMPISRPMRTVTSLLVVRCNPRAGTGSCQIAVSPLRPWPVRSEGGDRRPGSVPPGAKPLERGRSAHWATNPPSTV